MADKNNHYGRLVAAGWQCWQLGWQATETAIAAQTVIGARLAMIGAGMREPHRMPLTEIERMASEKMVAFTQAAVAASREMGTVGDTMEVLDITERMLAVSLAWWKPIHARTTANARRLGGTRRAA